MQCKQCGSENLDGSFFCEACGAQLAQTKYCRFCGGIVSFETGCCTKCKRDRDGKKRSVLGEFGVKAGQTARDVGGKIAKGTTAAAQAVAGAAVSVADKTKRQLKQIKKTKNTIPVPPAYCQVCGGRNDPAAAFCMNCGAPMQPEESAASAQNRESEQRREYQGAANAAFQGQSAWQPPQWNDDGKREQWQEQKGYNWGAPTDAGFTPYVAVHGDDDQPTRPLFEAEERREDEAAGALEPNMPEDPSQSREESGEEAAEAFEPSDSRTGTEGRTLAGQTPTQGELVREEIPQSPGEEAAQTLLGAQSAEEAAEAFEPLDSRTGTEHIDGAGGGQWTEAAPADRSLREPGDGEAEPPSLSSCARCGAKLVPGARFCGECGAPAES